MATRRTTRTVIAVVAAVCAALVGALLVTTLTDRDGDGDARASAPRVIPAVRSWEPASGPGWRPGRATRVVADPDGPLADEARLLARELRARYATADAGEGDVELVLDDAVSGGPEAYRLTTEDGRVTIAGSADNGVFYGTRTLLQAVRADGRLPEGEVRDRPDRRQRGLLLDIARKHYDAAWIKDRIREMADLKLNQLQLHVSDDQAFRLESSSHPEVVSARHLSKAELKEIVELAHSRHVAVVPEIDSPGHLGAVLRAHPDLQLRDARGEPVAGAIDISRPAAGRLVDDLLREYAPLFAAGAEPELGRYWHLGGDEYLALAAEDPEARYPRLARAARRAHGSRATVRDLATAWVNDRARTVRSLGWTPQVWNDGMHRGGVVRPSRESQVAYWTGTERGQRDPAEYLEEKRQLVNLNDAYLYYVLGEPNQFRYPTGARIYREWTPAVLRGSEPEAADATGPDQVPGARFAVWGDRPRAQTAKEVARGIRRPLQAFAQKVWDPRPPRLSWREFTALAQRLG